MAFDREFLESIVSDPRESLDVEVKRWLDPTSDEGKAKIARACIALRNNNGGCLLIGFDDSGNAATSGIPSDIRKSYHADVIQHIVTQFASHAFEVRVEFVTRDAIEYPIICVPSGVETPVAAKRDLLDSTTRPLIQADAVYVRSLSSNNTVSTTIAKWQDYERLTKHCFDNREADIGAFVRRHLANFDLSLFVNLFGERKPKPTATESATEYLAEGAKRFEERRKDRNLDIPPLGTREVAVVVDGVGIAASPDDEWLSRLLLSRPRLTGWPPWVDLRNTSYEPDRPYFNLGGWECFLAELVDNGLGTHLDFWRIEPQGRFYHFRALEDDMERSGTQRPKPGTEIDFMLQVSRLAEMIACALAFARTMQYDEKSTTVGFAFRWAGLKGRHLTSWVESERHFYSSSASHQDAHISAITLPLDVPQSAISTFVEQAVVPLFLLFGGTKFHSSVIKDIAERTLTRNL